MTTPRSATKAAPPSEPPLVYVGGDPCLDLVNTTDWHDGGGENERLTSYSRLTRWAEGAGVLSRQGARQLRKRAEAHPGAAAAALKQALALRSELKRLFHAVARGSVPASAWTDLDELLRGTLGRLGIVAAPATSPAAARWHWRGGEERLDSLLWPVIWAAGRLLTSDEADRVRVCDGPGCGWVFVDRSRNHLRRWCQMETCGTAAKTRRRRARRSD